MLLTDFKWLVPEKCGCSSKGQVAVPACIDRTLYFPIYNNVIIPDTRNKREKKYTPASAIPASNKKATTTY